jgi:hypothetical protein
MNGTAEKQQAGLGYKVINVDGDEILSEFAKVMLEWGHYRTASGLTFPTPAEAFRVAAGRRDDRGWNRFPLP